MNKNLLCQQWGNSKDGFLFPARQGCFEQDLFIEMLSNPFALLRGGKHSTLRYRDLRAWLGMQLNPRYTLYFIHLWESPHYRSREPITKYSCFCKDFSEFRKRQIYFPKEKTLILWKSISHPFLQRQETQLNNSFSRGSQALSKGNKKRCSIKTPCCITIWPFFFSSDEACSRLSRILLKRPVGWQRFVAVCHPSPIRHNPEIR